MEESIAQAVRVAAGWVRDAKIQCLKVYETQEGPARRLEAVTANSLLGQARGAVAVLRILRPDDPQLQHLFQELNHAPVIMIVGESTGLYHLNLPTAQ